MSVLSYYNISNLCHTLSVYYGMGKLPEKLSFRTSEESAKFLKDLADSDERSVGYVINKMITYFKSKSIDSVREIV